MADGKGKPGKAPIWEWDWPFHSLLQVDPYYGASAKTTMPWWPQGNMPGVTPATQKAAIPFRRQWAIPAQETVPVVTPPATVETERDMAWYVPGEVVLDRKTGKFYDASGAWEISEKDALAMRNAYDRNQAGPGGISQAQQEQLKQQHYLNLQSAAKDAALWARQKQADEFEGWRNTLLGQMTGPANEVARWFVAHKPNPYTISRSESIGRNMANWRAEASTAPPAEAQRLAQVIKGAEEEQAEAGAEEEQALALAAQGPPTPAWLSQYVPGVGKNLGSLPFVPTPSGQMLSKMSPSQSSYMAGAIDWFGGRSWQDILAETESMLPQAPRRAATRWSPARVG